MGKKMLSVLVIAMFMAMVGGVNASEGLVSYWKFDEGSGTTVEDSAGDNDGTIHGATWTDGVCGSGLSFDGVNDKVTTTIDLAKDAGFGSITTSVWFNTEHQRSSVFEYFRFGLEARRYLTVDPTRNFFLCGLGNHYTGVTYTEWDKWNHIACVGDGSRIRAYLNGVEVSNTSYYDASGTGWIPQIGYSTSERIWYKGVMDELSFYNRALSAEEVSAIYQTGLNCLAPPDSDGDGVLDSEDMCLETEEGATVNTDGCSIAQLCPVDDDYKNHGKYVSCVSKTAEAFLEDGLITGDEKGEIVSAAAKSDVGKKAKK